MISQSVETQATSLLWFSYPQQEAFSSWYNTAAKLQPLCPISSQQEVVKNTVGFLCLSFKDTSWKSHAKLWLTDLWTEFVTGYTGQQGILKNVVFIPAAMCPYKIGVLMLRKKEEECGKPCLPRSTSCHVDGNNAHTLLTAPDRKSQALTPLYAGRQACLLGGLSPLHARGVGGPPNLVSDLLGPSQTLRPASSEEEAVECKGKGIFILVFIWH